MKKFFLIQEYLRYRLRARNAHGVHSPFIYDMVCRVLFDNRHFYAFDQIEELRKNLLTDNRVISVEDFGAGSHIQKSNQRKIKEIAQIAGRSAKHGQLLFRFVNHYHFKNILELGTSLGLATSYLAMAQTETKVTTVEGCRAIAEEAKINFEKLGISVDVHIGKFDDLLESLLQKIPFDLLFIDGNHRKQPTLDYFHMALPYVKENTMIIFDDIHWSKEMKDAWDILRHHPSVRCSIDLFQFGIVLFRKDFKEKQHFILRHK